jgi:hypothetical protein
LFHHHQKKQREEDKVICFVVAMEMKKFFVFVIKRWERRKNLHGEFGNEIGNICA